MSKQSYTSLLKDIETSIACAIKRQKTIKEAFSCTEPISTTVTTMAEAIIEKTQNPTFDTDSVRNTQKINQRLFIKIQIVAALILAIPSQKKRLIKAFGFVLDIHEICMQEATKRAKKMVSKKQRRNVSRKKPRKLRPKQKKS